MASKTVLVTGADRGFGLRVAQEFLRGGYTVFAGKFLDGFELIDREAEANPGRFITVRLDVESRDSILAMRDEVARHTDRIDVFVSNAAFMGGGPGGMPPPDLKESLIDVSLAEKSVRVNALGALLCTEALLPLMQTGMKRLCYVSSEVASINQMMRDNGFRYPMSKTALNMAVRMLHNSLHGEGFTFRLYHPGPMRRMASDGGLSGEADPKTDPSYSAGLAFPFFTGDRPDEDRLVMVDFLGYVWPF